MTLKEAHEIQRKELISLRAENKRLKSGTFTNEEKQFLKKEIRSLRATVKELNTTIERYQYWLDIKKNAYLSDIVYGDFELPKNEYAFLQQRNEQLTVENQSLTDSNDKLKAQMNLNHENFSIPSSKENFPKKIKNS